MGCRPLTKPSIMLEHSAISSKVRWSILNVPTFQCLSIRSCLLLTTLLNLHWLTTAHVICKSPSQGNSPFLWKGSCITHEDRIGGLRLHQECGSVQNFNCVWRWPQV